MVTRVEQTITHGSHPGVLGNCLQAAVASYLELPLEAVPHFVQFDDWFAAVCLWAEGRNLTFTKVHQPSDEMVIAFGPSPRGEYSHAVVWQNGATIADPHPDQSGLKGEPYEFWAFRSTEGTDR